MIRHPLALVFWSPGPPGSDVPASDRAPRVVAGWGLLRDLRSLLPGQRRRRGRRPPGLTSRLQYLSDLGVTCLWLMPIAESPSITDTTSPTITRSTGTTVPTRTSAGSWRGPRPRDPRRGGPGAQPHVVGAPVFKSAQLYGDSPWRDWFLWSPSSGKPRDGRSPPGTRLMAATSTTTGFSGGGCRTQPRQSGGDR
jgi:hypothetical protein